MKIFLVFSTFCQRSGYFTIDGILLLEAILLLPFMCVYTAISARILAVTLWCMDSSAALKCNSYWLKSLLAGHLKKGSVHREKVYSAGECRLGVQIFLNSSLELTNQKRPKVTCLILIKIS